MAEPDSSQELTESTSYPGSTDAMTGGDDEDRQLLGELSRSFERACGADIIVSFLMETGVRELLDALKSAAGRRIPIRILTGDYLGITQPSALWLIKMELGDGVDLRFYSDRTRSFHPKSYIFHYGNFSEIFVGSSNISRSALTRGIEWNYRFRSTDDPVSFRKFFSSFEDLFENHSVRIDWKELRRYSKSWHKPPSLREMEKREEEFTAGRQERGTAFEPRGAQIEALCALETTRNEGARRALVQAATGVGKTYIAAFDSKKFKRVLFVAHRTEILKQAAEAFRNVRQSNDVGFFDGESKTTDRSMIFASASTLGRREYLNSRFFPADHFDYVVIDEFHHAVTRHYRKIAGYFKPSFLLGLTATPERMDGKNIFEICDYNVPYELSLRDAINRGMLVPFHYYGIYDRTDYSSFRTHCGRYRESDLDSAYTGNESRLELIIRSYLKYGSKQALGFCCSRKHAEEMAAAFSRRGIPAASVYSNADGLFSRDRSEALTKLRNGEIRIIFSVDMFNEGVDITSVDMVMFLRPTDSPVVFLQQLGRGLRRCRNKDYLNVLDFIGNYEKAGRTRFLLSGTSCSSRPCECPPCRLDLPDGCTADFDLRLIDLFAEIDRKRRRIKDRLADEFTRVTELLGRIPTRLEFFTCIDDGVYDLACANSRENPFRHYLEFLHEQDALSDDEKVLYHSIGREFIQLVEGTSMSRIYKMPVLMAFCCNGRIRMSVKREDILASWKEFFGQGTNWKDLEGVQSQEMYLGISDREHLKKIMKMPVRYLLSSGKGFFVKKPGAAIALKDDLAQAAGMPAFARHMLDVIEYRTTAYYQRRYRELSGS